MRYAYGFMPRWRCAHAVSDATDDARETHGPRGACAVARGRAARGMNICASLSHAFTHDSRDIHVNQNRLLLSRPPPTGTVTAACRTVPAQRSGDGRSRRPSWCELSGAGASGARSDRRRLAARFSSSWFSLSWLFASCFCCCKCCGPSSSSARDGPGRGGRFRAEEPPPPPPGSTSAFVCFNLTSARSVTSPPRTPMARAAAGFRIPSAVAAAAALLASGRRRLCSPPGW